MGEKTLVQRYVHILTVVACYWFVSITLVFVNKARKAGGPMFVTFYQCVVTVAACYAIRSATRMFPDKLSFPSLHLDMNIIKQVSKH